MDLKRLASSRLKQEIYIAALFTLGSCSASDWRAFDTALTCQNQYSNNAVARNHCLAGFSISDRRHVTAVNGYGHRYIPQGTTASPQNTTAREIFKSNQTREARSVSISGGGKSRAEAI